MDGTVGLSCQPVEISGRNYMLRHGAAELIRHDPAWRDGNYDKTPTLYMYAAAGNDLTESAAPFRKKRRPCRRPMHSTTSAWRRR